MEEICLDITKDKSHLYKISSKPLIPLWFIKFCRPSRMIWFAPLLGFILTIPSFFTGYILDDYIIRQINSNSPHTVKRPTWDLFNWFSSDTEIAQCREHGSLAWWTPDVFRWKQLRPVSSLIHALQFKFFLDKPWIMHLGLAMLYALLIFLYAKVLTHFSSTSSALGIAILLFAINDTHAYSAGWICHYNTILCCAFGLIALLMHIRWRRRKSILGLLSFIISFLLALLSSEGGLALMGYLIAYAIFIESGTLKEKAVSLIPGGLIASGYLCFYTCKNYGIIGSGIYLSPLNGVWGIPYIMKNAILLFVSEIYSIPQLTMLLQSDSLFVFITLALLLTLLYYLLKKPFLSNKRALFFITGILLSVLPFSMTIPMDRLLLWSSVGAAGLLGEMFTVNAGQSVVLKKILYKTMFIFHTVISILFFIPALFYFPAINTLTQNIQKTITEDKTVLINAPIDVFFMYLPSMRCEKGGTWPEHFYFLYAGADTLTVTCTGERTLQLETSPEGWLPTKSERLMRSELFRFKQGDTIRLQLMTAKVENVTSDGRPIMVTFTFDEDLTKFTWMKWTKNGPVKCDLLNGEMKLFASMF